MNLHLTRDEWDRIAAAGSGVLFRPGHVFQSAKAASETPDNPYESRPPAEFVEAAKPCTCVVRGGRRYINWHLWDCTVEPTPCERCDDGRQRHTITVPARRGPGIYGPETSGRITVPELAVVEWGPLVVEDGDRVSPPDYLNVSGYIIRSQRSELPGFREHWADGPITLPPDVDPEALVGQYALGIKVVEP